MDNIYNPVALEFARLAVKAAVPVLEIYEGNHGARMKKDGSPVTEADLASDRLIHAGLKAMWPDIPVISEEQFTAKPESHQRFFLVDPLDGTREFINRTGEFTINIALIENGSAVAGAIYAPVHHSVFFAGERAFQILNLSAGAAIGNSGFADISTRRADIEHLSALASRSQDDQTTELFLCHCRAHQIRKSGSSLKFCIIAKGEADLYPRFGPTMGWDIAAGHAILRAAGGALINEDGNEFVYSSRKLENGPFLALGDRQLLPDMGKKFVEVVKNSRHASPDIAG